MEDISTNYCWISYAWYSNLKGLTKNVYNVQSNMYQWMNAAKIYICIYIYIYIYSKTLYIYICVCACVCVLSETLYRYTCIYI